MKELYERLAGYECEGQMDIFDYEKECELEKWIRGDYMNIPENLSEAEIRARFSAYGKNIEERKTAQGKGC